jgi:hypothetical protein
LREGQGEKISYFFLAVMPLEVLNRDLFKKMFFMLSGFMSCLYLEFLTEINQPTILTISIGL